MAAQEYSVSVSLTSALTSLLSNRAITDDVEISQTTLQEKKKRLQLKSQRDEQPGATLQRI
eukprot:NODE_2247_length_1167_cov_3.747764_g1864_i0.p7 GENE.NODE_2247_length_1167_cov_3.747764_g1864_i0~~NODE_2247_length_1167_cov_3.747764_g1864_i0.p7  ORF type:complete len:61 (-),score=16.78 NODE_2247_length_1167_cov_3.747764_g1864_i0:838-1020(-)